MLSWLLNLDFAASEAEGLDIGPPFDAVWVDPEREAVWVATERDAEWVDPERDTTWE